MTTTANALVQLLESYDVSCVFGIPGIHTVELYRQLANSPIEHITPRHEQGAGFMADGYARVSGKPGVCFIISGPGMTNILTAMAQAWSESMPMLVISTVNSHGRMGSGDGWLHELKNQQALVSEVCAFSHTVHKPEELTQVIARAFAVFNSERPRPVHIEIPINILNASLPPSQLNNLKLGSEFAAPVASPALTRKAAHQLLESSCRVILVGGGAKHAAPSIKVIAEELDAPVVMTVNARGVLPTTHTLAVPIMPGLPAARALISLADVVLAIGTELGPTDYDANDEGQYTIAAPLIRVDIDAQQMQRNQQPTIALLGDANATCIELIEALDEVKNQTEPHSKSQSNSKARSGCERAAITNNQVQDSLSNREKRYIETLTCIRDSLSNTTIVGDSTQLIYAGNSAFGMDASSSWFNSAMGFGTLGYALPAAIGAAKAASSNQSIVAISGDGGLQFCLAELASAVDANLKLILIVHENGGYQEINHYMQTHAIEPVGVTLMTPDFSAIAKAFQWQAVRLESLHSLATMLKQAEAQTAPTMILIDDKLFDDA